MSECSSLVTSSCSGSCHWIVSLDVTVPAVLPCAGTLMEAEPCSSGGHWSCRGCAARLCSVGAVSPCALISGDCRASGAEPAVLAPRPVQLLLSKTFLCVCSSWLGAGPAGQTRRGSETGARRGGEAWSWLCPASVVGGAAPVARPRTGGSDQVCVLRTTHD